MRRQDLMDKSSLYLSINVKICSVHFEPSEFYPGSKRLKKDAVPTLFDIPTPPKKVVRPPKKLTQRHKGKGTKVVRQEQATKAKPQGM